VVAAPQLLVDTPRRIVLDQVAPGSRPGLQAPHEPEQLIAAEVAGEGIPDIVHRLDGLERLDANTLYF